MNSLLWKPYNFEKKTIYGTFEKIEARVEAIETLFNLINRYNLPPYLVHRVMKLVDICASKNNINSEKTLVLTMASFYVTFAYFDNVILPTKTYVIWCDNRFTEEDLKTHINTLLCFLKFDIFYDNYYDKLSDQLTKRPLSDEVIEKCLLLANYLLYFDELINKNNDDIVNTIISIVLNQTTYIRKNETTKNIIDAIIEAFACDNEVKNMFSPDCIDKLTKVNAKVNAKILDKQKSIQFIDCIYDDFKLYNTKPQEIQNQILPELSLSDFTVNTKIGEGTGGTVYDVTLNSPHFAEDYECYRFAIKRFNDASSIIEIINTVATGKYADSKQSESIIRIYDVIVHENLLYMLMEKADCDLAKFTELMHTEIACVKYTKHELNNKVQLVIKDIIEGIKCCHAVSIVHRDIKPQNILIKTDRAKICDYGISFYTGDNININSKNSVCTLFYRPPEVIQGGNQTLPSIDIWSLGCVIYEILTGKILYMGVDQETQLRAIQSKNTESIIDDLKKAKYQITYEQKKLLLGMLNVDLTQRPDINTISKFWN